MTVRTGTKSGLSFEILKSNNPAFASIDKILQQG
jgi:hypothetical protein